MSQLSDDQEQSANQNVHPSSSVAHPTPATLFPAYASTEGQQAAGWLQNASFRAMPASSQPNTSTTDQEARSKPGISLQALAAPSAVASMSGLCTRSSIWLPALGLRLQQAAEQLLPSSSSDSGSEDAEAEDQQGGPKQSVRHAVQASASDTGSGEALHRKHKRRREPGKHKKQKKHRCVRLDTILTCQSAEKGPVCHTSFAAKGAFCSIIHRSKVAAKATNTVDTIFRTLPWPCFSVAASSFWQHGACAV